MLPSNGQKMVILPPLKTNHTAIMKKYLVPVLIWLGTALPAMAQNGTEDPVLFTVAGEPVTRSEFLYVYQKNNPTKQGDFSEASLQEYLDLYINFKLKVAEAHALRIDTTRKVREELDKYGDQLIKSNFDKEVLEAAIVKHYDRMGTERLVYHVMQGLGKESTPADSAAALAKINEAWEKVQKGADFENTAREYSSDPNISASGGRVGWVTGFSIPDMRFEDMAFETKVGGVSPVFLTKYGYHFLLVKEERPASGQVHVQHILIKTNPKDDNAANTRQEALADSIYFMLMNGADFNELCDRYSDDQGTAKRGGQLDWFGVGKMVQPFEEAAFSLKNPGDISKPVKTAYGWHIIRLQEKRGIAPFEDARVDIKSRIERTSQYSELRNDYVSKVKQTYKFMEYPDNIAAVVATLDSTFLNNEWSADKAKGMDKPVFTIGSKTYTQDDLAITLQVKQRTSRDRDIQGKFRSIYEASRDNMLIEYDMSARNEDFRRLMQEYRDGIPLFALLEQKVWTAAAQDTAGLEAFYDMHKSDYMWEERVDASIYKCADAATAKAVRKMVKKNTADSLILRKMNTDSVVVVNIEHNKFLNGQNSNVDAMNKKPGMSEDILGSNGNITFIKLHSVIPPMPKTLKEARGYVISDYQDQLEQEWITSLREKYPVVVNEKVFNSMVQ